jgi:hypothetical protein
VTFEASRKRFVERSTFVLVHLVDIRGHELDLLAFGQVRGLVQDETSPRRVDAAAREVTVTGSSAR